MNEETQILLFCSLHWSVLHCYILLNFFPFAWFIRRCSETLAATVGILPKRNTHTKVLPQQVRNYSLREAWL